MGSHTPRAFAPDPSKWIDTASTKKRQALQQRPLVAFKHNVPTPPSSNRRPRPPGGTGDDSTPLALGRQPSLSGFLTPTTSGPPRGRQGHGDRLQRLRSEIDMALKEDTPTVGRVSVNANTSRRVHDFWGSDQEEAPLAHAGPSRPRRELPCAAGIAHDDGRVEGGHGATAVNVPLASQPIRSSRLFQPVCPETPRSPPPTSSPRLPTPSRSMTPIPDDVLAIHRRLCGRDTQRMKGVKSPWRKNDDHDLASNLPFHKRPRAKENTVERPLHKDSARSKVKGKQLVDLSDEEEQAVEPRGPMRDLEPNTGRKTTKRQSPVQIPPARQPKVHARPAIYVDEKQDRLPDLTHAHLTTTSPVRLQTPSEDGPYHTSPLSLSPSLTPRKRGQPHHRVTPPKSRTPQKISEHDETLFAFPPPKQPRFVEEPKKRMEWRPVQMDAETLLTWSLGGPKTSDLVMDAGKSEDDVVFDGPPFAHKNDQELPPSDPPLEPPSDPLSDPTSDPVEPENGEDGRVAEVAAVKRKRSSSTCSNTESLAPSVASQSFPHLISSSPKRSARPLDNSDPMSEPVSGETTPRVRRPRTLAADRWKSLEGGILSVPVPAPAPASPSASGKTCKAQAKAGLALKKKRKSEESASQTKLASFGFFSDGKRGLHTTAEGGGVFEAEWEAEADLEFGLEEEAPCQLDQSGGGLARRADDPRLGAVPPAPYHPSLRAAGVEEMKRRQAREEPAQNGEDGGTRVLAATPATPSVGASGMQTSDMSSSMTSSEILFPDDGGGGIGGMRGEGVGESARNWFERIGQRRSSEFGSFGE